MQPLGQLAQEPPGGVVMGMHIAAAIEQQQVLSMAGAGTWCQQQPAPASSSMVLPQHHATSGTGSCMMPYRLDCHELIYVDCCRRHSVRRPGGPCRCAAEGVHKQHLGCALLQVTRTADVVGAGAQRHAAAGAVGAGGTDANRHGEAHCERQHLRALRRLQCLFIDFAVLHCSI